MECKKAIAELNGLDVLINNAGTGVLGMQEFLHLPIFKKYLTLMFLGTTNEQGRCSLFP